MKKISSTQWSFIRFWLLAVLVVEGLMLCFNNKLLFFYAVIGFLFLGGFLLRGLRLYPGQPGPLTLDLSGTGLAFLFAGIAVILKYSPWRFLLIFCSSAIIMPHLIYIMREK